MTPDTLFTVLAQHVASEEQLRAVQQVLAHRAEQDAQHGGPEHDDTHTTGDFVAFICDQVEKSVAEEFSSDGFPMPGGGYYNPKRARVRLTKIAALAIAAMESLDRRGLAR